MLDYRILAKFGTTNERLREICTAAAPPDIEAEKAMPDGPEKEAVKRVRRDRKRRDELETRIRQRLDIHLNHNLRRANLYAAIDLAFDSAPITEEIYPLMLFAQNRINADLCGQILKSTRCGDRYLKTDKTGKKVVIDIPAFAEHHINLVKSMVTRRLATQVARYSGLEPYYQYSPRGTSDPAKLVSDVVSQKVDQTSDAYGYKHDDIQVQRAVLLYGRALNFARCSWEEEYTLVPVENGGSEVGHRAELVREGVPFDLPHVTRCFWDPNSSAAGLNTDTGMRYCGWWDVVPYATIRDNPNYWNRDQVGWSVGWSELFTTYTSYFNQYYTRVNPPTTAKLEGDPAWSQANANDRKNYMGMYGGEDGDNSALLAVYYEKISPTEWDVGEYPYDVWVKFLVAGNSGTVINAEIMPSRPGAYAGHNESDDRDISLSFAMALLPYQEKLTNLWTQLIEVCKMEQFMILTANVDAFAVTEDGLDPLGKLEETLQGDNWYAKKVLVRYSGTKAGNLGIDMDKAIRVVQPTVVPQSIQFLFESIIQLIATVERLEAFSANEAAQPIVKSNGGVTAQEAGQIDQAVAAVNQFISFGFDEFRSAKKRVIFESLMSKGSDVWTVPVTTRYPLSVVMQAGMVPAGDVSVSDPRQLKTWDLRVTKSKVRNYEVVFSGSDVAQRTPNPQVATALAQIVPVLTSEAVVQQVTKGQFFSMLNAIFRNIPGSQDVVFDVSPEEADQPLSGNQKELMEQIVKTLQMLSQRIDRIEQLVVSGQNKPAASVGS